MDDDTLNLLKTVCAAGRARSAFDDNSNERLEELENAGLLDLISTPSEDPNSPAPRVQHFEHLFSASITRPDLPARLYEGVPRKRNFTPPLFH